MRKFAIFVTVVILMFATIACNFSINLPNIQTIETGPTTTEDIFVPIPDTSGTPEFEIAFGAGELSISPGAQDGLAQGTATYNVSDFEPRVIEQGGSVKLQQGDGKFDGIPNFGNDLVMEWDLKLADTPMELVINGGANQTTAELGGLSLTDLTINQGAADSRFRFSELNHEQMGKFEVNAGAANINLLGLANANVSNEIVFKGGAGNYTLEFDGELQRDLDVSIDAGLGNLIIVVPEGVSAEVTLQGALTNINSTGEWDKSGSTYMMSGTGPTIYIDITMAAGNLDLRN